MHRVHTEKLSKTEKRAVWDKIIQDFLSSGLGVTKYSKKHGLRGDLLNYYVKQYRHKQTANFIPVAIPSTLTTTDNKIIIIELGKLTLSIPVDIPAAQLNSIMKGIISSC